MTLQKRWDALDLLRGLSIAGMILSLFPGDWTLRYRWTTHALWNGATVIDMVSPCFLFCVGVSLPLSLTRQIAAGQTRAQMLARIARRTIALIVLGLLINGLPDFDLAHWRIPGILQRIGLAYGLSGALIVANLRRTAAGSRPDAWRIGAVAVALLSGYGLLQGLVPPPGFETPRQDQFGAWNSVIDRVLFGIDHLWRYGFDSAGATVVYDPDGLLSTLCVCFNMLCGALAGMAHQARPRPAFRGAVAGSAMFFLILAYVLDPVVPINKSLWSASFALLSTGVSLATLLLFDILAEWPLAARLFAPLRDYGQNALLAFVICWVIFPFLDYWHWQGLPLRAVAQTFFGQILSGHGASFLCALLGVALLYGPVAFCTRRGWLLRL